MADSQGFGSTRFLLCLFAVGLSASLYECGISQSNVFPRRIKSSCKIGCLLLHPKSFKKCFGDNVKSKYHTCIQGCARKRIQSAPFANPTFILLKPEDPIPKDLIITDEFPQVPKEFQELIDPAIRTYGNCDSGKRIFDRDMKQPILARIVSVSCVKNKVLVEWEKPKEIRKILGYQINYRFGRKRDEPMNERGSILSEGFPIAKSMCYEFLKDKTSFLIDKEKGFEQQSEIHLTVAALPLPVKCDINMTRYPLSNDLKVSRKRRSTDETTSNNTTKAGPVIKILGPNDPIPTGLIMPSTMPKLTLSLLAKYVRTSNCESPRLYSNKTIYAGQVNIRGVFCQKAGKFTKKGFNINWDLPKNYLNVRFSAFQILYSVMKKNQYDPRNQFCKQVDKTIQSYTITEVESTDTVNVAVIPYPNYSKMSVYLKKFKPCMEVTRVEGDSPSPSNVVMISSVTVAIVLLVVIAAVFIYLRRRKDYTSSEPQKSGKFYVSYYPDTKSYHQKLLNLIAQLRRNHSLNVIMDTTCQTQVADFGLPRWCQLQLTDAAKIVVVVSKEYLKVCEEWQLGKTGENGCTAANRVCWELQYVVDNIFERRKNSRVFIILADVKASDLPDFLRGRQIQAWPKNSEEVNRLACGICGVEEVVA